jgi:hypothetical protein
VTFALRLAIGVINSDIVWIPVYTKYKNRYGGQFPRSISIASIYAGMRDIGRSTKRAGNGRVIC